MIGVFAVTTLAQTDDGAATLLLGEGIQPKIVSEMLGHSNIAITLDLYSHVTPAMQRDAALALNAPLVRA